MKILELFSGTSSFGNIAKSRGHQVFTIDFDKSFNPDLCIDILNFDISMLPEEFKKPDIIWASPPCQTFSVASIYRYWDNGKPKNEKTLKGIEIAKKTLKIIEELKPKFWIIENPRGMLRKQDFMLPLKRDTITYCQYGFNYQKATDLWNNLPNWTPRPMCKPKSPCHIRSPRGSKFGVQGLKVREGYHPDARYTMSRNAKIRSIVPPKLCEEILIHCEETMIRPEKPQPHSNSP